MIKTLMVIVSGISSKLGKLLSARFSKGVVLRNEQKFIPCKKEFVLLEKAVNLLSIFSQGVTLMVSGGMAIIGIFLMGIVFKDIIVQFSGMGRGSTASIIELFMGLIIAGITIIISLPVFLEHLIICVSKIKFNNEGMLIQTFFKTKHLPWQKLKNIRVTYLGQNVMFVWNDNSKAYLNFIAYKNVGSIFRCAYKYSSSQSVKDKLLNYYKLLTGHRLPKY